MSAIDTFFSSIVVVVWGLNFVAVKLGTHVMPPFLLTAMRFTMVAALTVPFFRVPRKKLGLILLLSALMGSAHFGLFFYGMKALDAATTAIIIQLTVPFASIVAAVVYKERLGRLGVFGMTLAFVGVALLAGEPQRPDPLSIALEVVAAAAWALSNVVIRKIGPINPLALNGWMGAFAAPQLIVLSYIFEDGQIPALEQAGWLGWSAVSYTAIASSLIGYSLWYRLIARNPLNKVVPFTLLNPIVGVIGGVTILGEPLGWHKVVGGLLTILGVAVIQLLHPPVRGNVDA
jgi:O-acetylserine/cysteine efflux transporter